jgi:hypothetical protein
MNGNFWLEFLIIALIGVAFGRLYFIIESKTDNQVIRWMAKAIFIIGIIALALTYK